MKYKMLSVAESRSRVYNLLAELFLQPIATPGSDYAHRLFSAIGELESLPDQGDYAEGARLLKNYKALAQCGNLENIQKELAIDRTRLCRGTLKKDAVMPPYEALFVMPEREIDQLLVLVRFYQRAGLKVSSGQFERMDYIGVELAFMAGLCEKERMALEAGQDGQYQEILALEREFMRGHLLKWVPDYCDQMIRYAQTAFFRGFAYLLRAFLKEEKEFGEQA